jgi:fumarate reductase subunit D
MGNKSIEPLLWIMFSAGGVLAAMVLPVLMLLFGIAFPLGWFVAPSPDYLLSVLGHPLTRLGGFVVCLFSLIHAAHRFRYTLYDGLQIKHLNEVINVGCYGGELALAVFAALSFWVLP